MDAWTRFERACLDQHGVADVALARSLGVSRPRFFDRTAREGWSRPLPGIRLHPEARPSVQQRVVVVCRTSEGLAAASGETAAWLHGLRRRPPERVSVLAEHGCGCRPHDGVQVRRARWLLPEDVVDRQCVPTLSVPATLVSLARFTRRELLALLIDAVHRRLTTPDEVMARLAAIGPVPGRGVLRGFCEGIVGRQVESIFQEEVAVELERLGYGPERSTRRIVTSDGHGLTLDVPLPAWQVAVEPDGDAYHRSREQRRIDRRRDAALASTDWVRVPVDWRDWHLERGRVLDSIDAAIEAQRRRGVGAALPSPRVSRGAVPTRR